MRAAAQPACAPPASRPRLRLAAARRGSAAAAAGALRSVAARAASPLSAAAGTSAGRRVVVVGGGWAGFGAAKALTETGYDVTLLDASANVGGLSSGWRTAGGQTVEAGMKARCPPPAPPLLRAACSRGSQGLRRRRLAAPPPCQPGFAPG